MGLCIAKYYFSLISDSWRLPFTAKGITFGPSLQGPGNRKRRAVSTAAILEILVGKSLSALIVKCIILRQTCTLEALDSRARILLFQCRTQTLLLNCIPTGSVLSANQQP